MVTMGVMDAHKDSFALDKIGTNAFVAAIFGCTSQYVSKWRKYGIPRAHRMYLELRFPVAFESEPDSVGAPKANPELKAA